MPDAEPTKAGRGRGKRGPNKSPRREMRLKGSRTKTSYVRNTKAYDDRILEVKAKVWELHIRAYSLREIAKEIQTLMDLSKPPDENTVSIWVNEVRLTKTQKLQDLRDDFIVKAIERLELIIKEHLPLAAGLKQVVVARHDGLFEVLDENYHKEQSKSAEIAMKALEQYRRIVGVGLISAGDDPNAGATSATVIQINTLIQNVLTKQAELKQGNRLGAGLLIDAGDEGVPGV
jgi:hypothetical protein